MVRLLGFGNLGASTSVDSVEARRVVSSWGPDLPRNTYSEAEGVSKPFSPAGLGGTYIFLIRLVSCSYSGYVAVAAATGTAVPSPVLL